MKKLALLLPALVLLTACAAKKPNFVFQEKTVVDQNSGLVWMKSANMPGRQLVWRSDDNVYYFIKGLNDRNFEGYADWRVPTKGEMKAMIGYAKGMGYDPARMETWPYRRLQELGFTDVRDYGYWTATRESSEEIWIADMATGKVEPLPENRPYYLWPVRGTSR